MTYTSRTKVNGTKKQSKPKTIKKTIAKKVKISTNKINGANKTKKS